MLSLLSRCRWCVLYMLPWPTHDSLWEIRYLLLTEELSHHVALLYEEQGWVAWQFVLPSYPARTLEPFLCVHLRHATVRSRMLSHAWGWYHAVRGALVQNLKAIPGEEGWGLVGSNNCCTWGRWLVGMLVYGLRATIAQIGACVDATWVKMFITEIVWTEGSFLKGYIRCSGYWLLGWVLERDYVCCIIAAYVQANVCSLGELNINLLWMIGILILLRNFYHNRSARLFWCSCRGWLDIRRNWESIIPRVSIKLQVMMRVRCALKLTHDGWHHRSRASLSLFPFINFLGFPSLNIFNFGHLLFILSLVPIFSLLYDVIPLFYNLHRPQ